MLKRSFFLGLGLLVGASGAAHAEGAWDNLPGACGGGLFVTCASVSVSWTGLVITLTATNQGSEGDLYKAIGLVNLGPLPAGWNYTVGGQSGYAAPGPNDLGNFPANRAYAVTNSQASMLGDGQTGVWTFTFTGITSGQLDGAMATSWVALHGISGPNGCSTKVAFLQNGGTSATDQPDPNCDLNTVVPEPATMVLLATGLIGLAGVQLRRRKNTKV